MFKDKRTCVAKSPKGMQCKPHFGVGHERCCKKVLICHPTTNNAVLMIGFHFMLHSVAMAMMALILYAHSKVAISIWI